MHVMCGHMYMGACAYWACGSQKKYFFIIFYLTYSGGVSPLNLELTSMADAAASLLQRSSFSSFKALRLQVNHHNHLTFM